MGQEDEQDSRESYSDIPKKRHVYLKEDTGLISTERHVCSKIRGRVYLQEKKQGLSTREETTTLRVVSPPTRPKTFTS